MSSIGGCLGRWSRVVPVGLALVLGACGSDDGEVAPASQKIGSTVSYPEGPVYHKGQVYFVEYGAQTIMAWDGQTVSQLCMLEGCGPSGLVVVGDTLVVSCYDSNTLVRVDMAGQTVEVIDKDSADQPFVGPNDFVADGKGGFYFSASGVFDASAPVAGKVFHHAADGKIVEVAQNIHYSNGLTIIDGGKTLLVSEHLAAQVLKFDIQPDNSLANRAVWKKLSDLAPPPADADAYTGPDGLDVDRQGNVYICQYGGSRVLVTRPDGTLLRTLAVPAPFVTNIGFGDSDTEAYVTAVDDTSNAPYPGNLYLIDNK